VNISVQIIDDVRGITLESVSSLQSEIASKKLTKTEQSKLVGKMIAERALSKGIDKVVFDRNGYIYHGRIKSLAESAREAGLNF
jgi:large subunit ribosomal protein L18